MREEFVRSFLRRGEFREFFEDGFGHGVGPAFVFLRRAGGGAAFAKCLGEVADQFWMSKAPPPEPDGGDSNTTTPDGDTSDSKPGWQQKLKELPGPGLPGALGAMAVAAWRRRR